MLIYIDSKPTDALVLYRLYNSKRHKLIYYTKEDILDMLSNKQEIKGIIAGVTDYGNIVDFIARTPSGVVTYHNNLRDRYFVEAFSIEGLLIKFKTFKESRGNIRLSDYFNGFSYDTFDSNYNNRYLTLIFDDKLDIPNKSFSPFVAKVDIRELTKGARYIYKALDYRLGFIIDNRERFETEAIEHFYKIKNIDKYKLEDTKLNKQIEKTKREIARYIVNLGDITVKSCPSYNYTSLESLDLNKTILEKLKYCDYILELDWAKQYLTQLVLLLQNKYYNMEKIYE